MIPQLKQHIKCYLKSGVAIEGYVEEWLNDGNNIVIQELDGYCTVIIHDTNEILLTKIIHIQSPPITPTTITSTDIKNKLQEAQQEIDPELHNKSLQELHTLVKEQEKAIIRDKTKEHFSQLSETKYSKNQLDILRHKGNK